LLVDVHVNRRAADRPPAGREDASEERKPTQARRGAITTASMTETPVQVIGQPAAAGDDTAGDTNDVRSGMPGSRSVRLHLISNDDPRPLDRRYHL
jgi:hypothetical protein